MLSTIIGTGYSLMSNPMSLLSHKLKSGKHFLLLPPDGQIPLLPWENGYVEKAFPIYLSRIEVHVFTTQSVLFPSPYS